MPPSRKRARPSGPGVAAADVLAQELQCGVCLGLLCRPHVLSCGHAFCGACIHSHARAKMDAWEHPACPVCREILCLHRPPTMQMQMSASIDRFREGLGEVLDESLDEWHERQARWDADAAGARAGWGWRGTDDIVAEDSEVESEHAEPRPDASSDQAGAAVRHAEAVAAGAQSLDVRVQLEPDPEVEICFRMLRHTSMGHVMDAFCRLQGPANGFRRERMEFVYFHRRQLRSRVTEHAHIVRDDDTGEGLGMRNGDVIVARANAAVGAVLFRAPRGRG